MTEHEKIVREYVQNHIAAITADAQNAAKVRNNAIVDGTWGTQQGKTVEYTAPKVVVPESKKTSADRMWDRNSQPVKIEATTRAKQNRDRTKKEYDDYVKSDEYRKRMAEHELRNRQEAAAQMFLNPGQPMAQPKVIQDEKEMQLRASMEQAEKEYNDAENQKVIESDLEAITGLSEDERRQLEQYATGRDVDYYESLNFAQNGDLLWTQPMGRAEKEAAALIEKYGKERVDEMANSLSWTRNEKIAGDVEAKGKEQANNGFWSAAGASAATIPAGILAGIGGVFDFAKDIGRNDTRFTTLDPNAMGNMGNIYSGAVRGQVAQNISGDVYDEETGQKIKDGGFLRELGSVGYQGLMSWLDNIARAAIGGSTGGAALAATGSFSQTMASASKQGASPAEAAFLATVNSGIEAATEKIPLDDLLDIAKGGAQPLKQALKTALKQAGVEAATEELSLIGTTIMEMLTLREKSSYIQEINEAIVEGVKPEDAIKQANDTLRREAVNTLFVSMFSGAASSLTGSYAAKRGLFAEKQEQTNPELNRPADAKQAAQTAIENNQARRERMAAAEGQQADPEKVISDIVADGITRNADQKALENNNTNAVSNPIDSYPPEKQKSIRSYLQSVDNGLKSFVERVKNGDKSFKRQKISNVSDRAASDISKILGIDAKGYTHNINTGGVQHILNRHGSNGEHDRSMSSDDDIARVGWVLDNYDSAELLTENGEPVYSKEFKDSANNPAPQIRFVKKIDGSYYVVEAACENKYKKLWVQSAYLQKNNGDVTQVSVDGPSANHKTNAQSELASPSPKNSIPNTAQKVNGNTAQKSDYYDEFESWGADPNKEGVKDPMADRSYSEVGKRSVNAYMYENPAVKPFYQEQAAWMLSELADSTKGERTYNEQLHYESGGEQGLTGTKRHTSDSIAELLDQDGMTYDQIERGLYAIVEDHGLENNAASKRIELVINDRLMNGYTDFYSGKQVPGNAEYLNLLRNQQSAPTADTQKQSPEWGQIKGTGAAERNFSGVAAYEDMLSDDNVQKQRPGAVRDVEMPKQDSDGRRVTEFASNVVSAGVTPDSMADAVKSLVGDKELSFDTRTNEQSLENAAQTIREKGGETVMADIHAHAESKTIADGDIEKGLVLYAQYANDPSDASQKAASQIIVDMAALANMSGRNLQLFGLLKRMTPEGQLMAVNKAIENNTKKMQKAGMVKKDFVPVANEQLQQNYLQAAKDAKNAKSEKVRQEAEQSMQELQNAMSLDAAAQMPSTFKAKWDAWRYIAMLGNAKTQIRNIGGNLAFAPYKVVKDKIAALGEKLFVVPKDQRTKSLTTDYELMKWARQDSQSEAVNDALKYSAKLGDDVSDQKLREGVQIFGNKKLDDVRKFVESVPGKGDMFFKSRYYASSLAGFLRARGYKSADIQNGNVSDAVLNEARAYAIQEAMKATFNDCNVVSDFFATDLRYKGDNPVGKLFNIVGEGVMPFRRTPANIAVRFEEYSPMGMVNTVWKAANMVKDGKYTAASVVDSLASSLTGSMAMALGFVLAKGIAGVKITGSGADEDEKRQGHQEYALEFSIDGQEYSYKIDWAAPANLPLFVGANICESIENAGGDADVSKFTSFMRGLGNAFEPMLALSCLSGINDLFESARYAEEGTALYTVAANIATGYFTQGIPALVRQTTQAFTENKQTTFTTSDDPTIRDIQNTVSGLGVGNVYKTDKVNAWGEKENLGTAFERVVNSFLNPGTVKKIDNSAAEQEITRLNKAGQDVTPNTAARTISYIDKDGNGHDEVRLTEEQFQTLAQTQGQTARKLVDDMISSKSYAAMTDAEKAEAINTAYLYARKTGEIAAIGEDEHTGYDQSWFYDVEKGGAEEILRRVLNSSINTATSDLDNAWDKGYSEENFSKSLEQAYESYDSAPAAMRRKVFNEASGTAKKYIEARDKGLTHQEVISAIENVVKVHGTGSVNKETGQRTVRDIDRRQAIASTKGLTDAEKDILMKAYMADYDPADESPETTEFKYDYARKEMGLSPDEYAQTYRAYLDASKRRDKIAAIRALGYDYATANALYKLYGGSMKKTLLKMYG